MPTKTPAPKTPDTVASLMETVDRGASILAAAYTEDRHLTFDETMFFRREWLLPEYETERRLMKRFEHVVRNQQISGTAADREALAKAAEDAAQRVEQEGPAIREQIEQLQRKLNSLEREASSASRRVDESQTAVKQLRSLCPTPILRLRDSRMKNLQPLMREIQSLRVDADELRVLLSLDTNDPKALETLHTHQISRDCVRRSVDPHRRIGYHLIPDVYQKWREDSEAELAEMLPEIARLQAELDAAEAEVDTLRDYWLR